MVDISAYEARSASRKPLLTWRTSFPILVAGIFWVSGYLAGDTRHAKDFQLGIAKGYETGVAYEKAQARAGEQSRLLLEKKMGLCVYAKLACARNK